jgi:hypothetical protein
MLSFMIFTHPDSSGAESSLPTGRQASLREEREKRVSLFKEKPTLVFERKCQKN